MEEHFQLGRKRVIKTKFGPSLVYEARLGTERLYVLPRHGMAHDIPPHRINYRANVAALAHLGAKRVIATTAVGSMRRDFGVGELGLVEQFIDLTKNRPSTFFDDTVRHTDMTRPYNQALGEKLMKSAARLGVKLRSGLVYVCVDGPRYESAAEIRMYRAFGGDVVGMTGLPEVVLANELGLKYASLAIATNLAAGMQGRISHSEVISIMGRSGRKVKEVIEGALALT